MPVLIDDATINKIRMAEQGSPPSTPASGFLYLYSKADGLLYSKDDAGTETLVSGGSGGALEVAVLEDQKTSGTDGGTFTAGAWRTRDLNTEVADPDNVVSIASNEFTLVAGTYLIVWHCPCFEVGNNQTRLYDVTGAAEVKPGMSTFTQGSFGYGITSGAARVSIGSSNTYRIEHYCGTTQNTNGFGVALSQTTEVYTRVEIYILA